MIFEEAAGIVKFKVRREEANKQLLEEQANLQRVSDILEEASSRLEPLEKQAAEARKHRNLTEELSAVRREQTVRCRRHFAAPFIVFLLGSGAGRRRIFSAASQQFPVDFKSAVHSGAGHIEEKVDIIAADHFENASAASGAHESDIQRSRIFPGVFLRRSVLVFLRTGTVILPQKFPETICRERNAAEL